MSPTNRLTAAEAKSYARTRIQRHGASNHGIFRRLHVDTCNCGGVLQRFARPTVSLGTLGNAEHGVEAGEGRVTMSSKLPANDQLQSGPDFIHSADFDIDETERQSQFANSVFGVVGWHLRSLLRPCFSSIACSKFWKTRLEGKLFCKPDEGDESGVTVNIVAHQHAEAPSDFVS